MKKAASTPNPSKSKQASKSTVAQKKPVKRDDASTQAQRPDSAVKPRVNTKPATHKQAKQTDQTKAKPSKGGSERDLRSTVTKPHAAKPTGKAASAAGKTRPAVDKTGSAAGKVRPAAGKAGSVAGKAESVVGKAGSAAGKAGSATDKTGSAASKTGSASRKQGMTPQRVSRERPEPTEAGKKKVKIDKKSTTTQNSDATSSRNKIDAAKKTASRYQHKKDTAVFPAKAKHDGVKEQPELKGKVMSSKQAAAAREKASKKAVPEPKRANKALQGNSQQGVNLKTRRSQTKVADKAAKISLKPCGRKEPKGNKIEVKSNSAGASKLPGKNVQKPPVKVQKVASDEVGNVKEGVFTKIYNSIAETTRNIKQKLAGGDPHDSDEPDATPAKQAHRKAQTSVNLEGTAALKKAQPKVQGQTQPKVPLKQAKSKTHHENAPAKEQSRKTQPKVPPKQAQPKTQQQKAQPKQQPKQAQLKMQSKQALPKVQTQPGVQRKKAQLKVEPKQAQLKTKPTQAQNKVQPKMVPPKVQSKPIHSKMPQTAQPKAQSKPAQPQPAQQTRPKLQPKPAVPTPKSKGHAQNVVVKPSISSSKQRDAAQPTKAQATKRKALSAQQ